MAGDPGSESSAEFKNDPVLLMQRHAGLVVAGATSLLVCLKILAVARWDSTTAFGILASSGTTNVLTGTLLAVLPFIYGLAYISFSPELEHRINMNNKPFGALEWLRTLALIVLITIVPGSMVLVILMGPIILRIIRWKNRRKAARNPTADMSTNDAVGTKVELVNRGIVLMLFVLYMTLPAPWLPAELIKSESGEQVGYVLAQGNEYATVLLSSTRTIERIDVKRLTGTYCMQANNWLTEPLPSIFTKQRYIQCR